MVFFLTQKSEVAPYYVARSLAGFPQRTPLAGLALGLETLAAHLAMGSSISLLVLEYVARRAQELLSAPTVEGSIPAAPGGSDRSPSQSAGLQLIGLVARQLLLVDIQVWSKRGHHIFTYITNITTELRHVTVVGTAWSIADHGGCCASIA